MSVIAPVPRWLQRRKRHRLHFSSSSSFRGPAIECLESRRVLAIVWDGGGGNFDRNNADWSTNTLPGLLDDVEIPDFVGEATISHTSAVTTTINSLTSAESLLIPAVRFPSPLPHKLMRISRSMAVR